MYKEKESENFPAVQSDVVSSAIWDSVELISQVLWNIMDKPS